MSRNIFIALAACSSLAQAYDCATVDAALRQQFAILGTNGGQPGGIR